MKYQIPYRGITLASRPAIHRLTDETGAPVSLAIVSLDFDGVTNKVTGLNFTVVVTTDEGASSPSPVNLHLSTAVVRLPTSFSLSSPIVTINDAKGQPLWSLRAAV
ncbi:hypothetical protein HJC99_02675 [Candidatus Saccharibacteria bacterium]|nr:hypothetical protein [Candidatus Saccharibacteria bacterium]